MDEKGHPTRNREPLPLSARWIRNEFCNWSLCPLGTGKDHGAWLGLMYRNQHCRTAAEPDTRPLSGLFSLGARRCSARFIGLQSIQLGIPSI